MEREEYEDESIPDEDMDFVDEYGIDDDLLMPGDELELSFETYKG